MKIDLNNEVSRLLSEFDHPEEMANSILISYLKNQFIRRSEIAGSFVTRPFHKSTFESEEAFDASTQEFKGVVVNGVKRSESLFVADDHLCRLLQDHQVVLVMKSPRNKGIRVEDPEKIFVPASPDALS